MRYRLLITFWLVTDLLLFIGSYAVAYFLRVGWIFSTDFPFLPFLAITAAVSPLWLAVLASTGTFRLLRSQATFANAAQILYAALVGSALFALAYYFAYGLFFSRALLLIALVLNAATTTLWHWLFDLLKRRILRKNPPAFPTLIIGVTRESRRLLRLLDESRSPLKPVAVLDAMGVKDKEIEGVPVRGKLNVLEDVIKEHGITHLIQCSDLEHTLNMLSVCKQHRMTYILLPSVLGIVEGNERVETLEGCAVTMVEPSRSRRF